MGLRKQAHPTFGSTIEYAPRVQIGEVLNEALDLYQRFFWRFVAVAAVVFVGLDLIGALGATAGSDSGKVFWGLIGVVLSIVGTFWVQGALTEAVNDVRDGRDRHDDRRALLAHAPAPARTDRRRHPRRDRDRDRLHSPDRAGPLPADPLVADHAGDRA